LELSPAYDRFAVKCTLRNEVSDLIILNAKGEKIDDIGGPIQEYLWLPDGSKIMYSTGNVTYHGDKATIDSTGIWLYDIKRKGKWRIAEKGWNLCVVGADRQLCFFDGRQTVRYSVESNKTEKTKVITVDADYSPDGRYYIHYLSAEDEYAWAAPYWSPFRIFDTKTEQDLPASEIEFMSERNPIETVWGKDSKAIAFRGNVSRTDYRQAIYIYDVIAKKVIRQFDGQIAGFSHDRTSIVVFRDGGFFLEKMQ
jgi:hypothetical protein